MLWYLYSYLIHADIQNMWKSLACWWASYPRGWGSGWGSSGRTTGDPRGSSLDPVPTKEKKIFLIYKEIQKGSFAKSCMRVMRKWSNEDEDAVSHIWLCTRSILNFFIFEENFIFIFNSVLHEQLARPRVYHVPRKQIFNILACILGVTEK
jgi:hypothetical protein